jgi:hypothetical protein
MTAVVKFFTRSNSLVVAYKFSKLGIVVAHYWILEGMRWLRLERATLFQETRISPKFEKILMSNYFVGI